MQSPSKEHRHNCHYRSSFQHNLPRVLSLSSHASADITSEWKEEAQTLNRLPSLPRAPSSTQPMFISLNLYSSSSSFLLTHHLPPTTITTINVINTITQSSPSSQPSVSSPRCHHYLFLFVVRIGLFVASTVPARQH
jgi:hypothetical protein